MKEDTEQKKKQHTQTADKKKLRYTLMSVVLIAALIAGLTYAWFFNQSNMATLLAIKSPSDIFILGPDGSEMSSIDLDYSPDDKVGNTVTVRRVFCVENAEAAHRLEIVHTTNMKGLEFKLYKVSADGAESVTEDGILYKYNKTPLNGSYINRQPTSENNDYKYANDSYHDKNYATYDKDKVQTHAEPIYWLADGDLTSDISADTTVNGKDFHRTYYVCEVSWTETTKETDVFYILAENVVTNTTTE